MMNICNIKIMLLFSDPLIKKEKSNRKIIFKERSWTITIYCHTPTMINVTGLKQKGDIEKVKNAMEKRYMKKCLKYQINSIMLSHKDCKRIDMNEVIRNVKLLSNMFYIDFVPELFTGMYLKPLDRSFPTVNIFYTGSFQLLGAKSFEKIDTTVHLVQKIIKKSEYGMF